MPSQALEDERELERSPFVRPSMSGCGVGLPSRSQAERARWFHIASICEPETLPRRRVVEHEDARPDPLERRRGRRRDVRARRAKIRRGASCGRRLWTSIHELVLIEELVELAHDVFLGTLPQADGARVRANDVGVAVGEPQAHGAGRMSSDTDGDACAGRRVPVDGAAVSRRERPRVAVQQAVGAKVGIVDLDGLRRRDARRRRRLPSAAATAIEGWKKASASRWPGFAVRVLTSASVTATLRCPRLPAGPEQTARDLRRARSRWSASVVDTIVDRFDRERLSASNAAFVGLLGDVHARRRAVTSIGRRRSRSTAKVMPAEEGYSRVRRSHRRVREGGLVLAFRVSSSWAGSTWFVRARVEDPDDVVLERKVGEGLLHARRAEEVLLEPLYHFLAESVMLLKLGHYSPSALSVSYH